MQSKQLLIICELFASKYDTGLIDSSIHRLDVSLVWKIISLKINNVCSFKNMYLNTKWKV